MKLSRLLIAALVLSMVSFAFAQDNSQDQQEGKHHGRHGAMAGRGMGDPDQHLKMLTKQLNLTADQQAKIKPILEEQHSKMQQWMQSNQNASQEDRRAQMKQWHDETTSRVREVLTPDQQKKFDQMQQNMMEHHHGGHGNHDHGDHQGPSSM